MAEIIKNEENQEINQKLTEMLAKIASLKKDALDYKDTIHKIHLNKYIEEEID